MKKKVWSLLLMVVMLFALVPCASAADAVSYLYPVYNTANTPSSGIKSWETGSCTNYEEITGNSSSQISLDSGWYVVTGNVETYGFNCNDGAVNLILCDGASLTISYGISITSGSLTIYGQAGNTGALNVTTELGGAGIQTSGGSVTINGGTIYAEGSKESITGKGGAGIGGGEFSSGSNITINGGTVTAKGASGAAGIGGGSGYYKYAYITTIDKAGGNGTNIRINGGTLIATAGSDASGIGSGYKGGTSSGITAASNMIVKAGSDSNPSSVIPNNGGDLASSLNGKRYVKIETGVAQVDSTLYTTLQSAINAANNKTVKILVDIAENVTVASGPVTLDLNGHTLKGNGTNSTVITNNGTLHLVDSSTNGDGKITGGAVGVAQNGTMSVANNVAITGSTKNLYLADGKTVEVKSGFNGSIGVSLATLPTEGTRKDVTGTNDGDYSTKFHSDNSSYKICNDANVLKLRGHEHKWSYKLKTGSTYTIEADCADTFGTCNGTKALTIAAPTSPIVYDGTAKKATLSATSLGEYTVSADSDITYYKVGETTALGSAPVDAGNYKAEITVGGKTASVTYTIAKKKITFTLTANELYYNGTAQELLTAEVDGGTMQYFCQQIGQDWDTVIPKATDKGTYTIAYKVDGDTNHEGIAFSKTTKIEVEILKGIQTVEAPYSVSKDAVSVTLAPIAAGHGDTKYGCSDTYGEAPDTWQDGVAFYNLSADTTYYFFAKYTGDDNYNEGVSAGKAIKTELHSHSWTYTASGDTITAACGNLGHEGDPLTLKIVAPAHTVYKDGNSPAATLSGNIYVSPADTIKYYAEGDVELSEAPTNPGNYIARITVNGVTASVAYTIGNASVTLTAAPAAVSDLTYNGSNQNLVTAGSVQNGTLYYACNDTSVWSTTIPQGTNADTYTVYYKVVADTYYNDVDATSISVTIEKATQTNKPSVTVVNESIKGKADGSISGLNITTMEYYVAPDTYCTFSDTTLTGLAAGTKYMVRYKATDNYKASDDVTLTIAAGRTLTVTFNSDGGSAVSPYTNLVWHESISEPNAPTRDGFTFNYWTLGGSKFTFGNQIEDDITLTASWTAKQSSPGGSVGGGGAAPTTTTSTIPVSGDKNSVNVQVTVSGTDATIANITADQIKTVGTGTDVTIDLTSLKSSVTGVIIPKTTMENVAKSVASGLEVKMPNGTVASFDNTTLSAVAQQAKSADVQFVVNTADAATKQMNTAQKSALQSLNNPMVVDAYFVSNGTKISDFKGGMADITTAYTSNGSVRVWYIDDNGTKTLVPCTYNREKVTFIVSHFSYYAIESYTQSGDYSDCLRDSACPLAKFSDVNTTSWYHDGVHYCLEKGLMNGQTETKFAPSDNATRAMITTALYRLAGSPKVEKTSSYSDVLPEKYYADAVAWAEQNNIITGYPNGTFGPKDAVTREQMAAIFYRFAQYMGIDVKTSAGASALNYSDAGTSHQYSVEALQWMCNVGLMNGIDNKLAPRANTSRSQTATILQRFCETFQ